MYQDRDDWMVCPVRWAELDQEFGPFTVDACVAESRANAYCYLSWSKAEDARVQRGRGSAALDRVEAAAEKLLRY
ncbi:hypothetical protein CYMTET_17103 [Cymbomonas tetramitiformis]|uniref:Uncharacterized protein n=1 Tax=Cymbomonas tetramitiformis TaxID=36881 RepID=A0AAE0FK40_9CHLO|nr:hypothetical protein CYMTET_29909 [Cymbomonas tetramitiformis]KAK3274727.1 hypothetical protein CYMTET_17103 [Cymbomonas tetramitiformis]